MSVTVPVWVFVIAFAVVLFFVGERANRNAPSGGYVPALDGCGWIAAAFLVVIVTAAIYVGIWIGGAR